MILEATPAPPPPPPPPTSEPQQPASDHEPCSPALDLGSSHLQALPHPAAASSPQQESLSQDTGETPSSSTLPPDQASGPLLYLSESLQESLATDGQEEPKAPPPAPEAGEEDGLSPGARAGPHHWSPTSPASQAQWGEALAGDDVAAQAPPAPPRSVACVDTVGSQAPAARPKKDRLARLRELGLDPPPAPKLCPDDGTFIHLEPPQPNPGKPNPPPPLTTDHHGTTWWVVIMLCCSTVAQQQLMMR